MHAPSQHDPDSAAAEDDTDLAVETELSILRDIFRMLPAGVTVQDERGRFLLVNDAAALQLGIAAGDPDGIAAGDPVLSQELHRRRETGLELLRTGRPAVAEETVSNGPVKQVLLTAHRPVRIADRNLLLSSSADISEQKAVEDHLFRSAYYDELIAPTACCSATSRTAGLRWRFSTSTISSTSTTITATPSATSYWWRSQGGWG